MPDVKTVIDDLGSQVVKELLAQVDGLEVKSAPVNITIANTATGVEIIFITDVDLVVTDVIIGSDAAAAWSDTTTDITIDHDTDLAAFAAANVVLNRLGFNTNNFPLGVSLASDAPVSDTAGSDVTLFPFVLPAGSALRATVINNEGAQYIFSFSVKYHPAEDLLEVIHAVNSGKVLKTTARP